MECRLNFVELMSWSLVASGSHKMGSYWWFITKQGETINYSIISDQKIVHWDNDGVVKGIWVEMDVYHPKDQAWTNT